MATENVKGSRRRYQYHCSIDISPLFELGGTEEGEQTLKALPYVIDWFGRAAEEAVFKYNNTKVKIVL